MQLRSHAACKTLLSTSVIFSLLPAIVYADDINIDLPINAVTVHPSSAIITRAKNITLPAGEHRLIVGGLPANVDPARLLLSLPNNAITMGSLEVERQHQGDFVTEQERKLRDELETMNDRRREISDEIETARNELQLLTSIATGGNDASVKPTVNGNELGSLITTISSNASKARKKIRDAEKLLRDTDKDIEQKEFEINQIATRNKVSSQVTANIRVTQPVSVAAAIQYPEYSASWHWTYEARLDSDKKAINLLRQAVVRQNTGDDWQNVQLKLTIADERQTTTPPELNSQYVDFFAPRLRREYAKEDMAPVQTFDAVRKSTLAEAAAPMQEPPRVATTPAQAIASQYLVEYELPGKVSVKANQQNKVLPIDEKNISANLIARSVPEKDPRAFLEARFTFDEKIPYQAGLMQLYRDGAYVGRTFADAMLPNKEIKLAFGVDERIKIEVQNENEESKEGGILRRTNVEQERVRFDITNYHAQPIKIDVLAQLPVSRNSDIEVEIPKEATTATQKDLDGKPGVTLWSLTVAPNKSESIKHYFDISFPKDKSLQFSE